MKQHNASLRHFRQPEFEIVPDRLIGMQAVDVQKIDRSIAEMAYRIVEGHTQQPGKCFVMRVVICRDILKDLVVVEACMNVALPGIDCITPGIELMLCHALTEREVGVSCVRPEFYENTRPQRFDNPECKGNVPDPADRFNNPRG
nr:hypothetical protein [Chlorobium sp.]